MGYLPACLSVILVSLAQIAMKFAMSAIPAGNSVSEILIFFSGHPLIPGLLIAGLGGYALSMVCWFFALKRLALSKAYALLSLSYIVVWGLALMIGLPGEGFSVKTLAGVSAVICGVILVCLPAAKKQ